METTHPSLEDWRALYGAAIRFKKAAPWKWMYDSQIVGIRHPDTGETTYGCVMGNLGVRFALAAYLGAEGLLSYLRLADVEETVEDEVLDAMVGQRCLVVSFDDKRDLERRDLDIIKKLGLEFKGRSAWPMFRVFHPPFAPQPLDRDQAQLLTLVLDQVLEVALRAKNDSSVLDQPSHERFFVRIPQKTPDGLSWSDQWIVPDFSDAEPVTVPPVDVPRLERIRQTCEPTNGMLEAHSCCSPFIVREKKDKTPAYHPTLVMFVDHRSGVVFHSHVVEPWNSHTAFVEHILRVFEGMKHLPRTIYVKRRQAQALLQPIAESLNITLKRVDRLPMFEEAYRACARLVDARR